MAITGVVQRWDICGLRCCPLARMMAALTGWTVVRRFEGPQPETCEQCGGMASRPATRREQLARWFTYGAGAGTAWYCQRCSALWSGGSSYGVVHRAWRSGSPRRMQRPLDVLSAWRRARTWHPMPLFYAAVGVAASAPALVVAIATPVGWWTALVGVPVVTMVGVFLWSMATAVGRDRRDVL
jgi:hypothetical protein